MGSKAQPSENKLSSWWDRYGVMLEHRLHNAGINTSITFPVICQDLELPANARYQRDTIWLGTIQRDYHTLGDTLSLIYHEYLHKVWEVENRYPVITDNHGSPVQWITDTFYTYKPLMIQVERDVENLERYYRREYPHWDQEALAATIKPLRDLLAKAREIPFRYAPSNLALEEIAAYRAQLEGVEKGLYDLSDEAVRTIRVRLHQLENTYEMRVHYERSNELRPDGKKRKSQRSTSSK